MVQWWLAEVNTLAYGLAMPKQTPLSPLDWIQAGYRTLTRDGIDRVKVEPLARELGVSKGSFYWHFKDRNALLLAMLQHWHSAATLSIIETVDSTKGSAEDRLRALVTLATAPAPEAYGGADVEQAIRAWARHSTIAADTLLTVDQERIAYTRRLFSNAGLSRAKASVSANALYATLIGLDSLPKRSQPKREATLMCVLEGLLAQVRT